ncbi:MAG: DUF423 domain-containing protein [Bdellovibrionota bacterium]
MLSKQWLMAGAVSGFFSVVLGAFGAHALKEKLSERALSIYQTAVHYQMFHALALLALGLWAAQNVTADTSIAGYGFLAGIVIFSGSLYALAVTDIRGLGAITPIGGVAFLIGWAAFAMAAFRA